MVVTFSRTTDGSCCCPVDSGTGTGTGTGSVPPDVLTDCCPNPIPGTLCVTVECADCAFLNYEGFLDPEPFPEIRPWNVCVPFATSFINEALYNADGHALPFFGVHLSCRTGTDQTGTGTGTNSATTWEIDLFIGDGRNEAICREDVNTRRITGNRDFVTTYSCDPFCAKTRFFDFGQTLPGYLPCLTPASEVFITIRECGTTCPPEQWYCWETGPAIYEVSDTDPGGSATVYSGPYPTCEEALANCPSGSCP